MTSSFIVNKRMGFISEASLKVIIIMYWLVFPLLDTVLDTYNLKEEWFNLAPNLFINTYK